MMGAVAAALVASDYPDPQAEAVLADVAHAYGAEVDIALLPTMVLSQSRSTGYTRLRSIRASYRFDQMVAAQAVIAQAVHNTPAPADVTAGIEAVRTLKPSFPAWLRVVGYALSSLGFAACFQMDLAALIAATVLGAVVGVLVLNGSRLPQLAALLPFLATLLSGILVAALALATNSLEPVRLVAMPVVVLLPGAVLTSGLIELASGYMVSGTSRLMYALMILGTMAFGFAVAMALMGMASGRLEDLTGTRTPLWVAWLGAALFGVGTFLYFCTPIKLWLPSLVVCVVSFVISMAIPTGMGAALMAGVATFVGLVLAWVFNARIGGGPGALAIFLPTFWLIVPGSALFVLFTGDIESAKVLSSVGPQAILSFLSMAIGMMLATATFPLIARITPNLTGMLKRGLDFLPTHLSARKR